MRPLRSLLSRTGALVAVAVLATACRAELTSHIVVTDVDVADVRLEVAFTGDAAVALSRDGMLDDLVDTFERRTGTRPDIRRSDGALGVAADVTYDQLVAVSDITGVGGLQLSPAGDGTTTLTVDFVAPAGLARALQDAVSSDTTGATYAAMAGSTRLVTLVDMPGGVDGAAVSGDVPTQVTDTRVTVEQPLDRFRTGSVAVAGTPGRPGPRVPLPVAVTVVVGGAAGWALARRRSRTSVPA